MRKTSGFIGFTVVAGLVVGGLNACRKNEQPTPIRPSPTSWDLRPTFTPTGTPTAKFVLTPEGVVPAPTETSTPTATHTVTVTPTEIIATVTPTRIPPTATAVPTATEVPMPAHPFSPDLSGFKEAPNCGTVYFKGEVIGPEGRVNGIWVQLTIAGSIRVYRQTGVGENEGAYSFVGLAAGSENLHNPAVDFSICVVESPDDPVPLSSAVFIDFQGCDVAGQFEGLNFRQN